MILYVPSSCMHVPRVQRIIRFFPHAYVQEVNHYKNIADLSFFWKHESALILGEVRNALLPYDSFGYEKRKSYSLKHFVNCVYSCKYCYLYGMFRNAIPVVFVNYEDMKQQIERMYESLEGDEYLYLYSANYGDHLVFERAIGFCEEFIPWVEQYPRMYMEIRTKSTAIHAIKELWIIPKNTEVAFSLSPDFVQKTYERGTPSLMDRIDALKELAVHGWRVWVRIVPVVFLKDGIKVYSDFFDFLEFQWVFERVYSVSVGRLCYTHKMYRKMFEKNPYFEQLYTLHPYGKYMKIHDVYFQEIVYMLKKKVGNVATFFLEEYETAV